jgi:ABC-type hemin transport system substrate-binding protein
MVLGRDTFAGDVLRRLGIDNVFADSEGRYPRVTLEEIRARNPDLVVLPDEPYAFGPQDGPEAYDIDVALVSGRHLTWYGPSLLEARDVLQRQLKRVVQT